MINFQTSIADFVRFIPVLLPKQVKSEPKLGEICYFENIHYKQSGFPDTISTLDLKRKQVYFT